MKKNELKVFQANTYTMSKQTFSLNEKRVMQYIIAKIKPTDTEFKKYEIPIIEIADMAKINNTHMYSFAKTLMTDMVTKFILLQDPKNQRLRAFNYFTQLDYENGILTVELNRNIHHLFLQLIENKVNFTAYELAEFMTLSSTHAQRIYELLKQYSKSRQREREIDVLELKKILNIEDKYKLYADFRKRVLDFSYKHIQENTNLRYKWKGITKRGRKVVAIKFYDIHDVDEDLDRLKEKAFLETYKNMEIYNKEFNIYIKIKEVKKNKDKTYTVVDKFDNAGYVYQSKKELQECVARAKIEKLF